MSVHLTRHLTFANVCSALALTVALGTGTAYAANTVRSTDIVNGQVRTVDLGTNAVTTAKIATNGVRNPDLNTAAVDARVIKTGGVTSAEVAADSLTADDLAAASVGGQEIQTDGVNASEVAPNAIDGDEVADGTMTSSDLAGDSVGASELANNAVVGANVTNESLTFSDISGGGTTGNVSFGGGQVPTGRCLGFDVAVGGAQVGDAVVISVQEAMQDGVYMYGVRVSAVNTVRGLLCNMSGIAQAAITDLQVRIVTFR
jgi:hypothetical protein